MKKLVWVGSSLDDLKAFPKPVQQEVGGRLQEVQSGQTPAGSKLLKGNKKLAGVREIVSNYNSDTYRSIYTVKLGDSIYVLDSFKKKSKRGMATPQQDIDRIINRLQQAKEHHKASFEEQEDD
jgi:phage-related protein